MLSIVINICLLYPHKFQVLFKSKCCISHGTHTNTNTQHMLVLYITHVHSAHLQISYIVILSDVPLSAAIFLRMDGVSRSLYKRNISVPSWFALTRWTEYHAHYISVIYQFRLGLRCLDGRCITLTI